VRWLPRSWRAERAAKEGDALGRRPKLAEALAKARKGEGPRGGGEALPPIRDVAFISGLMEQASAVHRDRAWR
jgi:hypothetical protein